MTSVDETLLLTPDEMAAIDAAAARSGIDSFGLMEKAGQAVAAVALRFYPSTLRFVVLCGPGSNGGDGYVAATALARSGCHVVVYALGNTEKLAGDSRLAFERCPVIPQDISHFEVRDGDTVIDAVFGAGLNRDVPDALCEVIKEVARAGVPVLAVDLPSGVCGRRGVPLGAAFKAHHTVTFMARKPGHVLMPGRSLCGDISVYDIGIPGRVVQAEAGKAALNCPSLWRSLLPSPDAASHKYRRGHLAVFSGGYSHTGASRLSAAAGLTAGAGLVTVASTTEAMDINACHLTAIMLRQVGDLKNLQAWLSSGKLSAFVLGPGFGVGQKARDFVLALEGRPLVLDADGITSFRGDREDLFRTYRNDKPRLVLTPHEGEFARIFGEIAADDRLGKIEKAVAAAKLSNAVIVYKGADTVIASPDGRAAVNTNAPAWLATAGSGDVLAGMIGALLANGMPAFEAAAAAVYLHGEAAIRAGRGMTAEDLIRYIAVPAEN
jgi:hydroxyethylthiazole kinase-like uncharacterized protein yjeF